MKNRLISLVFGCILTGLAGAQTNLAIQYGGWHQVADFISDGQGGWLIAVNIDSPNETPLHLIHFREDGSVWWDLSFPQLKMTGKSAILSALKVGPDAGIYFAGGYFSCDFGPTDCFAGKLSQAGDLLWLNENLNQEAGDLRPLADGSLLLLSPLIRKLGPTGELLWEKFSAWIDFEVFPLPDSTFLASSFEGLIHLDKEANFLKKILPSGTFYRQMNWLSDSSIVLFELSSTGPAQVIRLDKSSLLPVSTANLNANLNPYSEVNSFLLNDEIWLLTYGEIVHVGTPAAGFPLIEKWPLQTSSRQAQHFAIDGKRMALAGVEYIPLPGGSDGEANSVFLRTSDLQNPDFSCPMDIGVTEIRLENGPFGPTHPACQPPLFVQTIETGQVFITVKNIGSQPVDSLRVHFLKEKGRSICWHEIHESRDFEVNLAPGESVELPFGELTMPYQPVGKPLKICAWTSLPDRQIDGDETNNARCQDFDLLAPIFDKTSLTPNPAGDCFELKMPGSPPLWPLEFRLRNEIGQEVRLEKIAGPLTEVLRNDLPRGLYFWEIRHVDGQLLEAGKVVFQ